MASTHSSRYSRYSRVLSGSSRWYCRYSLQKYSVCSVFGTPYTHYTSTRPGPFRQLVLQVLASSQLFQGLVLKVHASTQSFEQMVLQALASVILPSFQCLVPQLLNPGVLTWGHFNKLYFRYSRLVSFQAFGFSCSQVLSHTNSRYSRYSRVLSHCSSRYSRYPRVLGLISSRTQGTGE